MAFSIFTPVPVNTGIIYLGDEAKQESKLHIPLTKALSKAWLLEISSYSYAIPSGEWSRGFIVVPNERVSDDKEYCDIVKKGIRQEKVDCMKLKDFLSNIKLNL